MSEQKTTGIGVIGCGNISEAYFSASKTFTMLRLIACSDLNMDVAKAKAEEYDCLAQTVDELLANPDVELVINLTIPAAHAEVNLKILEAGKHAYVEKPFSVDLEDGKQVLALAAEKGLRVGCAPDTFLGAGLQTCRKLIDDGLIGQVTSGTAFFLSKGPEGWHPNPGFFYTKGGGPMFDMGPYYITTLVHLLGPIKGVTALVSRAFEERECGHDDIKGTRIPVEVPTHYAGIFDFHSGAKITVTFSFDVFAHQHVPIELYGTEGSMRVPDPNTFGGPVEVCTPENKGWVEKNLTHIYEDNMRSIGAADMACAIGLDRPHRASGELAYHVLEAMHAFEASSSSGAYVGLESRSDQPAPLPVGLIQGQLD